MKIPDWAIDPQQVLVLDEEVLDEEVPDVVRNLVTGSSHYADMRVWGPEKQYGLEMCDIRVVANMRRGSTEEPS